MLLPARLQLPVFHHRPQPHRAFPDVLYQGPISLCIFFYGRMSIFSYADEPFPSFLSPELLLSLILFFPSGLSSLPGSKAIHPCFLPVLESFYFLHSNVAHFEMADSRVRKLSDKPEKPCGARKQGKNDGDRNQTEGAPNGQIRSHMSNEIHARLQPIR